MNNSKLLIIVLTLIVLGLVGALGVEVHGVWRNNHTTAALLDEANATTEADVLAQSIKTMQSNSALELAEFDDFVITDAKLVGLIEKVEEAGQAFNLTTNIVSVDKIEDKKAKPNDPRIIRLTVETDGSWSGTMLFLRALESLPHRITMEEVNTTKQETGWHMKVVISLNSFD